MDYIELSIGTIDVSPSNLEITQRYKVGDKLVILPPWDGRILPRDEYIEYHEKGEIGEVISLNDPAF